MTNTDPWQADETLDPGQRLDSRPSAISASVRRVGTIEPQHATLEIPN